MPLAPSAVRALCQKHIAKTNFKPSDLFRFEQLIVHSVEHNLASGRFQRLTSHRSRSQRLTLQAYVDCVIAVATNEFARLVALENKDAIAWGQLQTLLTYRAVNLIRRWRPRADVSADAVDFAQQACLIIYDKPFPCDVAFEAWAITILKNLISERYTRSRDVLDRITTPDSLDEMPSNNESGSTLAELIPDDQALVPFDRVEDHMDMLQAIDQLRSPAQRFVIIATFLEEQDDAQIARRLHKTKQAIYNLRDRALAKLNEILTTPPRKK
ncbi:MAG: sigma-70 family RNA polymerase sigma factor [Chloroflexi bacterium]|nr:sigma-70 family RNA polymerase sigma factor [Chloroflexota bacterium]